MEKAKHLRGLTGQLKRGDGLKGILNQMLDMRMTDSNKCKIVNDQFKDGIDKDKIKNCAKGDETEKILMALTTLKEEILDVLENYCIMSRYRVSQSDDDTIKISPESPTEVFGDDECILCNEVLLRKRIDFYQDEILTELNIDEISAFPTLQEEGTAKITPKSYILKICTDLKINSTNLIKIESKKIAPKDLDEVAANFEAIYRALIDRKTFNVSNWTKGKTLEYQEKANSFYMVHENEWKAVHIQEVG